MPQTPANKEYRTFVKGLITEAGPLTFPEDASLAEDNFELNTKGYRSRRLGLDYENSHTLQDSENLAADYVDKAVSTFKWEDVNTDASLIILVVQVGLDLWFYDATAQPVSGSPLNGGNKLTLTGDKSFRFQASMNAGKLVVVTGSEIIYQLVYDEIEDEVTYIQHGLIVRDIWGINDSFDPGYRPTEANDSAGNYRRLHAYNLVNQGWSQRSEEVALSFEFFTDFAESPSNADRPSSGIDSSDGNKFKSALVKRALNSASLAPRGSVLIDIFNRGASRTIGGSGLFVAPSAVGVRDFSLTNNYNIYADGWDEEVDAAGNKIYGVHSLLASSVDPDLLVFDVLPTDFTEGSIKTTASFAGRFFYAGFPSKVTDGDSLSPNLGVHIAFSQVVEGGSEVGKCYQEGDPTSVGNFDLVATDGGTIKILGAASILKLVPFGRSLLVFASNGVWEIRGGDAGFSATDFTVEKVTEIGCVSAESIVVAEDRVLYWSSGGIYALSREQVGFNIINQSLTNNTIQSLYTDLSSPAKLYSTGVYSISNKQVTWLYNDTSGYDGTADNYVYNRQLNYNVVLNAFYTYTIGTDDTDSVYPRVSGIYNATEFISQTYEEQVVVGTDEVQVSAEDIVIARSAISGAPTKTSYLAVKPSVAGNYEYTFAVLNNPSFLDWESDLSEESDAPAYIETGYEILNDTQRKKQLNYITVHMERTESGFDVDLDPLNESSCLLQVKWDYSDHSNSGKLGTPFQAYRLRRDYIPSGAADTFDYGQSVITTKNKVRGRGRALTMRFSTEAGKNCILYGWGALFTGNSNV